MPRNECIELYPHGHRVTCHAAGAVVGKTFVAVTADGTTDSNPTVDTAGAGVQAYGVAGYDAARDAKVPVLRAPLHVPVTAGGEVRAGDLVSADSSGRAVRATPPAHTRTDERATFGTAVLGVALTDASSAEDVAVALL